MKYIRTKDGIYDLDKSIWCEFTGHKVRMPYYEEYEKQPELCKTADTIEELCDGFYFDNDEEEFIIMNFYHYWWGGDNFVCDKDGYYVFNRNDFKKLKKGFYGYIKTDKGLIYVAKLNDKGELELL